MSTSNNDLDAYVAAQERARTQRQKEMQQLLQQKLNMEEQQQQKQLLAHAQPLPQPPPARATVPPPAVARTSVTSPISVVNAIPALKLGASRPAALAAAAAAVAASTTSWTNAFANSSPSLQSRKHIVERAVEESFDASAATADVDVDVDRDREPARVIFVRPYFVATAYVRLGSDDRPNWFTVDRVESKMPPQSAYARSFFSLRAQR